MKLALNYSDQALHVAESLVYLLETKQNQTELGWVLSSCLEPQNSVFNSELADNPFVRKAIENRKKAERHAKRVLDNFEDGRDSGGNNQSEWNPEDETKLKEKLNALKSDRNLVKTTVVELESPHVLPFANVLNLADVRKLDLETAVLMQVLIICFPFIKNFFGFFILLKN